VTIAAISKLVCRIRKNPSVLSELLSKREEKQTERAMIASEVKKMNNQGKILDSVSYVTERINQQAGASIPQHLVRDVMKKEVGARFKKVKQISLHENSIKNLILR
jgi:hypothetical protein